MPAFSTKLHKEDKGSMFFMNFGIFAVVVAAVLESIIMKKPIVEFSYTGIGIAVFGMAFRWIGVQVLNSHRIAGQIVERHRLFTGSLYGRIRHPCYLGAFFAVIGTAIIFNFAWGYAILAVVLPTGLWRINREEELLLKRFGQPYDVYVKNTNKLIPYVY